MNKKILLLSLMIVIFISNVLAITGSIGNARMVLRANTGEEIEKYVLVKNVNNVSLDIKISVSGDLEKYIELKDEEFTLAPETEKKAYFTIKVVKSGTTESKINVQFIPEEGQGVGLSSTIIVIAEGEDKSGWLDWFTSGENEENNTNENIGINVGTGKAIDGDNKGISPVAIALSITAVVFLVLIILLIIVSKKIKIKRSEKGEIKLKKRVKSHG